MPNSHKQTTTTTTVLTRQSTGDKEQGGGKLIACPRDGQLSKRRSMASAVLTAAVLLCAQLGLHASAQSWRNRVFDSLENNRALGDYFQPFLNNYYTSALPNNNQQQQPSFGAGIVADGQQLLTPASSASMLAASSKPLLAAQAAGPNYDLSITSASSPSPPPLPVAEQLVRQPAEPQASLAAAVQATSAPTTTSTTSTTRAPDTRQPTEQQARDSSGAAHSTPSNAKQQHDAGGHEKLSLVGKILDATTAASATQSKPLANGTEPAKQTPSNGQQQHDSLAQQSKLNVALQMLKARKQPHDSSQKSTSVVAVEQQIVNQHARAHHNHHGQRNQQQQQQQRLMPTKHRDNKLVSALLASYSPNSDFSSYSSSSSSVPSLGALLGQSLRSMGSSISSRSSIVKAAISDNKLSRTLSSVSKSIGGNKYIAGVGTAAALAALGLTVSKVLAPYMYASAGSSKLTEPLMTSGSFIVPSSSILPLGSTFMGPDRNTYTMFGPGESSLFGSLPFHSRYPSSASSSIYGADSLVSAPTSSSSVYADNAQDQQAALANYYALQQQQQQANGELLASYAPHSQPTTTTTARLKPAKTSLADNTAGHYASYYSNEDNSADSSSHPLGAYISGQPTEGRQPEMVMASGEQASGGDQIMSAASSIDAPFYAQQIPKFYLPVQHAQHQARRSGSSAVSIKLDEATRARLQQQLDLMQQHQQQRAAQADYSAGQLSAHEQHRPAQQSNALASAPESLGRNHASSRWMPTTTTTSTSTGATSDSLFFPTAAAAAANGNRQLSPATPNEQQQQQANFAIEQGQQQSAPTYLIIRPKTTSSSTTANSDPFAPMGRPSKAATTSDNYYHYYESSASKQQQTASNNGWRSVVAGDERRQTSRGTMSGQPTTTGHKQITSNSAHSPEQEQRQQQQVQAGGDGLSSNENVLLAETQDNLVSGAVQRVSRTMGATNAASNAAASKTKQLATSARQSVSGTFAKQRAQASFEAPNTQQRQRAISSLPTTANDGQDELPARAQDNAQLQADQADATMLMDSTMMNLIQMNGAASSQRNSAVKLAKEDLATNKNKHETVSLAGGDHHGEQGAKLDTNTADTVNLGGASKKTTNRQQIRYSDNIEDNQRQQAALGQHQQQQQMATDETVHGQKQVNTATQQVSSEQRAAVPTSTGHQQQQEGDEEQQNGE